MKKLLALVLTAMMALSLVSSAMAVTFEDDDLTWKTNTDPITFSLFHNMTWAPMEVWGQDHVSEQVTKDTGISFDVTIQSDSSQLATYVATGELPDAVFVFGAANIAMMENYDVSYAWDELIDQYAPEMWDLLDKTDIQMATRDDGHFYTLYTHVRNQQYWDDPTKGVSYGNATIAFRQDVMEELGNPEINSVEDFYNVLKAAKELHPEMIAYLQPEFNGAYLSWCFGIDYDGTQGATTVDENGNAIWVYSEKEPLSDYLTFANKLMREGLMSQEGLIYDQEQAKAAILGGDVFCYAAQCYDVDQWNLALAGIEGKNAYYVSIDKPLTVDGEVKMDLTWGSPGFAAFYITRNCKNPERLIALMEYMQSPYADQLTQWGVEGVDYNLVEGYPVQTDSYVWKEAGDNVWYFQAKFETENMKALAFAVKDPRYGQTAHLVTDYKPFWKYDVAIAMMSNAAANTREGDIYDTLDNIRKNSLNAIIVSATEEECAAAIESYFATIESAGVAEYNEFLNNQYQDIKAGFAE